MNSNYTYQWKKLLLFVVIGEIVLYGLIELLFYSLGYASGANKDHLVFRYPQVLWLNFIVLPLAGLFLYSLFRFNLLTEVVSSKLRNSLFAPVSTVHVAIKYVFFRIAFLALIFAIAQPYYGNKKTKASIKSMELVIALDISNSMNTKDIDKEMSRLDIAKKAITQLINNMSGERIGISIFAGSTFVQLPITSDYSAAKMFVNEIETGMLSNQGTNISEAIQTSAGMFSKGNISKAIILVTDGENHEDNPDAVYEELNDKNIKMCVLGLGTEQGGLVPNNPFRPELGYKQDARGNAVLSKLNKNLIRDIAAKANGFGMVSSSAYPDLRLLLSEINEMKRTEIKDVEFNVEQSKYTLPLWGALLSWLLFLCWDRSVTDRIIKFVKP